MSFEVIGVSGKAGSGKDYIAQRILAPLGYSQFSLAWHFKVWLVATGQATREEVFVTKPPHVRKLMQEEGTERGRMIHGNEVWCKVAAEWMAVFSENTGINKFVIPDIRFPNEIEYFKSLGGKIFRVQAPQREAKSGLAPEARAHISETALDGYTGFDGIIYNDPKYSESVRRQVFNLLNEEFSDHDDPEDDTTWFEKIGNIFKLNK